MKRFRQIWLVIVAAFIVLFLVYRAIEIKKSDSSGPVFSCDQEILEVSIQDEEAVLLQGIHASDKKDGDVTDSILVEKLSGFYDGCKRMATYAAFDSDNHITKMEREIIYTDYSRPRFELTGSLRFRSGETVNVDKIVKATDCLDGDISNKVKIHMDSAISNRVTGIYRITYEVTNSAGDTVQLPIDIEIYEPGQTEVELNLDRYLVYYDGQDIDYGDFLKSVKFRSVESPFEGTAWSNTAESGEEIQTEEQGEQTGETAEEFSGAMEEAVTATVIPRSRVTIRPEVDTSVPGVYPVYYYYRDIQEMITYEATEILYVVVE